MWIDHDVLVAYDACDQGIALMDKEYPNGVELIDALQRKPPLPPELLYWGYTVFPLNEQEKEAYRRALSIDQSRMTYMSHHCTNSHWVTYSDHITDCIGIFRSSSVSNSKYMAQSHRVIGSEYIFGSKFVTNGHFVTNSVNVTDSTHIAYSEFVSESKNVFNSTNIVNCNSIEGSTTLQKSILCDNCSNGDHLLFCTNLSGKSYQLFNQPIDAATYDRIVTQLSRFGDFEEFTADYGHWAAEPVIEPEYSFSRNKQLHYSRLSDSFNDWVQTLPGFDPAIMYQITFNPYWLHYESSHSAAN